MIETTPELATWMDTALSGVRVDLYTLSLATGQVLRWSGTNAQVLLPDGRLFAKGPLLSRGRIELRAGIEVDEMSVEITPTATDTVLGLPLLRYAREGGLRGCSLLLEWAYADEALVIKGVLPKFSGAGSPSSFGAGSFTLQVKSDLERLMVMMPRDVYQPTCLNTVYDAACAKAKSAMLVNGTVTAAAAGARSAFTASALAQAEGYFDKGVLRWLTGSNAGVSRTVRGFKAGGAFSFALPLPRDIAVGDTFEVLPGCDGTQQTCTTRFNNLARFRGQPFIPAPEVAT